MLNSHCLGEEISERFKVRGFTLIELLIGIAILGIVIMAGIPSYTEWIANARIRTTAESLQNGLMLAKAEAIKRNARVAFTLTSTDPVVGNVNSIVASSVGTNWIVRVNQSAGGFTSTDFVQGRAAGDGGQNVLINAGAAPNGCIFQAAVVFTGIGGVAPIPNGAICYQVSAAGGTRPLRVTVSPGGAVRMCDPGLSLSTTTMGC